MRLGFLRNGPAALAAVCVALAGAALAALAIEQGMTRVIPSLGVVLLFLLGVWLASQAGARRAVAELGSRVEEKSRAVREGDERFRQLAENLREVLYICDVRKPEMHYVSPAFDEVWGWSRLELFRDPFKFIEGAHPEDRWRPRRLIETLARGEKGAEDYRVLRPDGTVRWIRDRGFPVTDAAGEYRYSVGIAEDVTELKRGEEAERRTRRLEGLATLAAGISHELNNPLGAIQAAAEYGRAISAKETNPAELEELFENIARQARRGAEVTRSVLTFARGGSERKPDDLNAAVRRACDDAAELARAAGVALILDLAPTLPRVPIDRAQVESVVANLLDNAVHAGSEGGIVTLRTEATPGGARLVVKDDGEGMGPDVHERMFDPFFTTRQSSGGMGLGLSLVHGIVLDHGGEIRVESEPGAGTTIRIDLPAANGEV
jgi:two-component system cell cycle sensor histidine kinase/response regulator CckA